MVKNDYSEVDAEDEHDARNGQGEVVDAEEVKTRNLLARLLHDLLEHAFIFCDLNWLSLDYPRL